MKNYTLNILLIVATLLFGYLLWPYVTPLILASITAVLAMPLHRHIQKLVKDKGSVSALLTTAVIVIIIGIPFTVFVGLLSREVIDVIIMARDFVAEETVGTQTQDLLALKQTIEQADFGVAIDIDKILTSVATSIKDMGSKLLQGAGALAAGVANFAVGLTIFIIALFFLIRDGHALVAHIKNSALLERSAADKLFARFREIVDAIVVGNLVIAAIQGSVIAIAFPIFGLGNAILAGLATAILALIPAVGPLMLILPASAYLYVSSGWLWAVVFASLTILLTAVIDNILKPILLERRLRVHSLIVFLSLFGGISVFGFLGILYGPLIAALFLTLLDIRLKKG